jgi:hypothetical protein
MNTGRFSEVDIGNYCKRGIATNINANPSSKKKYLD